MNAAKLVVLAAAAALAAVSALLLAPRGQGAGPSCATRMAAFGWEANRLHGDGANLILPVTQPMQLNEVTVDYAMAQLPHSKPGAFHEVLAYLAVDPTGVTGGPHGYPTENGAAGWGASTRSGAASHGGGMSGDIFAQAILKDGYSGQLVTEPVSYTLTPGDRLVVHLDAVGSPVDAEAQGSVGYSLCPGGSS